MSDEFDTLFEQPEAGVQPPLEPASEIAKVLGRVEIRSVPGSSLATRGKLVELHAQLHRIERLVHDRRIAIERAFVRGAVESGATEFRTSAGVVKLKVPSGSYETRAQALRRGLEQLIADGHLSKEELEEACPVTITYGVNHTRLNYLAAHRGEAVREVIEANRTKVPGELAQARPIFPSTEGGEP